MHCQEEHNEIIKKHCEQNLVIKLIQYEIKLQGLYKHEEFINLIIAYI